MFLKVFSILNFSIVVFAALPSDCDSNRIYTVKGGDTCDSIAQDNNVSSFQLTFVNPSIDAQCNNLFVGEQLCLGRVGQDCTENHTVTAGESCSEIAANAGIALSVLLANNPNVNSGCTNLHIPEVLCTASNVIEYTSS